MINYSTLFSNICTSNLSPVHQATSPTAKLLSTAGATREAGGLMLCEDQILRAETNLKNPLATCLVKAALQKGCNRISAWWMFLVEFCQSKTVVWLKLWEFSQMSVTSLFKKEKHTLQETKLTQPMQFALLYIRNVNQFNTKDLGWGIVHTNSYC